MSSRLLDLARKFNVFYLNGKFQFDFFSLKCDILLLPLLYLRTSILYISYQIRLECSFDIMTFNITQCCNELSKIFIKKCRQKIDFLRNDFTFLIIHLLSAFICSYSIHLLILYDLTIYF